MAQSQPDHGALDGYELDDQAGFLPRCAHKRHVALFQDGMAAVDLTPMTRFTALARMVALGRVTQNHLRCLSAMDPATIQGVVRRLMARGIAMRLPDLAALRYARELD